MIYMQVYLYNKCMICTSVIFLQAATWTFVFEKKCFWQVKFITWWSWLWWSWYMTMVRFDHDPNHNDSLMIFKERMIPYYLTFSFQKLIKLWHFRVIFISYNYANLASSPTLLHLCHLWNVLNYYLTYLIRSVITDKDTGK